MNPPPLRDFAPQIDPVKGKTVLITGGTGSFGRKMVQTLLAAHDPKKVIVLSR
ncbi:MAG: polysaccharide biosynthesis protein, partial [Asticcacaulis sp.]